MTTFTGLNIETGEGVEASISHEERVFALGDERGLFSYPPRPREGAEAELDVDAFFDAFDEYFGDRDEITISEVPPEQVSVGMVISQSCQEGSFFYVLMKA